MRFAQNNYFQELFFEVLNKHLCYCVLNMISRSFSFAGNGHQLVRHRQHIAGSGYDEVLERKAHHLEEAGETK